MHFDQANQFQEFEDLNDAANANEANQVSGLSVVFEEQVKRKNSYQIDPEPCAQVFLCDNGPVADYVQLVVDNGGVENDEHVEEEEAVNDKVGYVGCAIHLLN